MNIPPLSQAILLGIGAVRNDRSIFLLTRNDTPCGCAIGTAIYAATGETYRADGIQRCHELWPWTKQPLSLGSHSSVAFRLSARHADGESRESLAAWIATIEPKEVESIVPAPAVEAEEVKA